MAGQTNLQKDVLVLNMEQQLSEIAQSMFDKKIAELTDQELYYVVLILTKRLMKVSDENEGEKKVYSEQHSLLCVQRYKIFLRYASFLMQKKVFSKKEVSLEL